MPGFFARVVHELLQRRERRILRHDHHHAVGAGDADRDEILQRLVVHLLRQREHGKERAADEQDGVAVARQAHRIVDADRAAGADLVLDDEGLAQRLGQPVSGEARHGVGDAAGAVGNHNLHRTGRPLLAKSLRYRTGQRRARGDNCR